MSGHGRRLTLSTCALIIAASTAPAIGAPEPWQEYANTASRWDTTRQYDKAIPAYKQALSMVPASRPNDAARINACLAIDLLRSRRFDEGFTVGYKCRSLIQQLKATNNIEPDTLLYAGYLVDACTSEPALFSIGSEVNRPAQQKAMALGLSLNSLLGRANKTAELADRILYAHSFVTISKDREAEIELRKILGSLKADDPLATGLRSFLAALEDKHGRGESLQKFDKELRSKLTDASRLEMIGQAQIWCADYKKGILTLNAAIAALGKTTAATANQEIVIRNTIVCAHNDRIDWKEGEIQLRKIIAIASKYPPESKSERRFKILLAENLRRQKRNREADAIDPKYQEGLRGKREYDFILNDEERAALKKSGDK